MIDLHCHILPGLDDGPADLDGSLELARVAVAAGTRTIVATPHIRDDFPFDPALIPGRVAQLNDVLRDEGVDLEVAVGGEVSVSTAADLDDATLRGVTLGGGPYLLVESPYTHATDMLEHNLFDLQVRGFRILLAHPERSPSFIRDIDRVARLVERGMRCSITAASMKGSFGRTVARFTAELFRGGLVHDVASDAHDAVRRGPDLKSGFRAVESDLPGLLESSHWFTHDAPAALLSGADLPPAPPRPAARRRRDALRLRG